MRYSVKIGVMTLYEDRGTQGSIVFSLPTEKKIKDVVIVARQELKAHISSQLMMQKNRSGCQAHSEMNSIGLDCIKQIVDNGYGITKNR